MKSLHSCYLKIKSIIYFCILIVFLTIVFIGRAFLFNDKNEGSASDLPTRSFLCPSRCICSIGDTFTVHCSQRNLDSVPDLPAQTTEAYLQVNRIGNITCADFYSTVYLQTLDLSNNALRRIYNCSFSNLTRLVYLNLGQCSVDVIETGAFYSLNQLKCLILASNRIIATPPRLFMYLSMLDYLDLSSNLLIRIKNDTFTGLSSLTQLYLYNNLLLYNNETFELDAFCDLNNLEVLNIQMNQPNDCGVVYPDIALSKLNNLREIYMDGYPAALGPGFLFLTKLEKFVFGNMVYGNSMFFCDLSKNVPDNLLENLCRLRQLTLVMSYCSVHSLSPDVLKPLKNIWSLNLNYNEKFSMVRFENFSKGLADSNLTHLNISAIDRTTATHFSHVTRFTFQYLKNTRLQTLDLSRNSIVSIHGFAFMSLPITLQYLSVKSNKLIRADSLVTLIRFSNLKVFDMSDQIQYTLSENRTFESQPVEPYLSKTNLTFNNTHENTNLTRSGGHMIYLMPKNLETIYAYSMKLEYSICWLTIKNNVVLRYFDYSNNFATVWEGPIDGVPSLNYLDLSRNYCTKMNLTFFQNATSLATLLLSQNVLGQSLRNDIYGLAFSYLHNLQILDLSHNNIDILSEKAFINNSNLKRLNLSHNFLEYFHPSIRNLEKLEILDLTGNMLKGLTEQNCKDLYQIHIASPKLKVLLHDNNLVCSCEFLYFLHVLTEQTQLFDNVQFIECQYSNGTNFTIQDVGDLLPILQRNCLAESFFIGALVSFCLVACVSMVAAVFYYKRWKLLYLYYIGKKHLHIGSTKLLYNPQADIFITYDDENIAIRQFVQNLLLPKLEQQRITFVLGELDFPGGLIFSSISGAVVGTKKTLVLISQDAFKGHSNEVDVGLHLAIMHELSTLKHIVVPVFMEEVVVATLPSDIDIYLQNQIDRCLEYVETETFWRRLFTALNEKQ
ncbi:TLR cluster1 member 12 [Biomphalaria glabrata]|nr:toll-like receptor 7 [Biomphalaria glabrata]